MKSMCNINDDRIYVELESQNKICKKIINIVKSAVKSVSDNELDRRLTVINLVGEEGSGKTTICRKLLAALSDWSAHYILCDETELAGSGIRTGKRRELFPALTVKRYSIFSVIFFRIDFREICAALSLPKRQNLENKLNRRR